MTDIKWGPTGEAVYDRTYQRVNPFGDRETWPETVTRVVDGNIGLVDPRYIEPGERDRLIELMTEFKILPAGRHLWASGVPGRQYLFNCHVAGWGEKFSDHFEFTFMRLMEGGGVGANYSSRFLEPYGAPRNALTVHVVCDPGHADYEALKAAGVLSDSYTADWPGSFDVADSREGWAGALADLLDTYYRDDLKHVDRVYDVTNVRPAGARLKTFGGTASGPLPLARMLVKVADVMNQAHEGFDGYSFDYVSPLEAMEIDHAIAECVVSGGNRRSARMSIVEWDDPFIMEFIDCKADTGLHWTTNISVAIDDTFLAHLKQLRDGAPLRGKRKRANEVHIAAVTGMLKNGEPGYWNRSLSQQGEPNEVICTNPCGEITLEAWENCNLGHVNMSAFYDDLPGAHEAHRLMARFLIRATYGDVNDPKQAAKLAANRRIGVGHFGVQGWLVKMGIKWSEAPDRGYIRHALESMRHTVRDAAREYAFRLRIPEPVKVTTVAPTGTIAKMPGATEGIHPIYSRYFIRRVRYSLVDPEQRRAVFRFQAQGFNVETDQYDASGNTAVVEFLTKETLVQEVEDMGRPAELVESVDEISLSDMLRFQAMYQEHYADNAVSFTANIPEGVYTVEEVAAQLAEALPSLKGTTLMPDGTRPQAPYERITQAEYEAATVKVIADGVDEECADGVCPVR